MEWYKEMYDYLGKDYFMYNNVEHQRKRHQPLTDFILEIAGPKKDAKILDIGCGGGLHVLELVQRGYTNTTGLDYSKAFIEIGLDLGKKYGLNLNLVQGDAREITYQNEYDLILIVYSCFGYFNDDENFDLLKRIRRALKPGGTFVLVTKNAYHMAKECPKNFWTIETVNGKSKYRLVKLEFDIVLNRVFGEETIIFEGGPIKHSKSHIRYYPPTELKSLLSAAKFDVQDIYAGYGKNFVYSQTAKLNNSFEEMIVLNTAA